jgi:HlyD family secretion protein
MRTATKVILGIGALAVVSASAAWFVRRGRVPEVEVQVGEVARKEIVSVVLANGKLQPRSKVDVSANIAGQVVNLAVREGDRVAKGDFLLQIDKVQYQASAQSSEANLQSLLHDLEAARAGLEQARYDHEKAQRSFRDELIPESELQRARSTFDSAQASLLAAEGRVAQARAALAGARDTLDKTTIRSPLDGIVTSLPIHEGEVAVIGTMNNPGTVLMTISDLATMEADLAVDETDVPRLAVGQEATLTIEAYPDAKFRGVVREVGSSPIQAGSAAAVRTGTTSTEAIDFEVKVTLLDPPADVRPGFSVTGEIETGRAVDVPVVPIQALVTREPPKEGEQAGTAAGAAPAGDGEVQEGVYVVEGDIVRFVPVDTGLTGALEIEIESGLEQGQRIVVGPFRALRELDDGERVRVAPPRTESEGEREGES